MRLGDTQAVESAETREAEPPVDHAGLYRGWAG